MIKTKIYLASRYSRNAEMREYAKQLQSSGFEVTSRWIYGNHQISDDGLSAEAKESERIRFATEDLEDLVAAHCTISFTEPPRGTNSRGGRHVEFGISMALLKRTIVVGHRENVFHCLPDVEFYPTWDKCLEALNHV